MGWQPRVRRCQLGCTGTETLSRHGWGESLLVRTVWAIAVLAVFLMLAAACGVDEPPASTVVGTLAREEAATETPAVSVEVDASDAAAADAGFVSDGGGSPLAQVGLSVTFTQVSAGGAHSCGVGSGGDVVCWGWNDSGQVTAPGGAFTQVSAGLEHSCGVRSGGAVVCWGNNNYGQATAPGGAFTQVSAGGAHSCGVRSGGDVVCWGDNSEGQATAPVNEPAWEDEDQGGGVFTQVSAGLSYSCGVRSGGDVVCWGWNEYGQVTAPGGAFTQVSAGLGHSCGVRSAGDVVCWGDNNARAGDGTRGCIHPGIRRLGAFVWFAFRRRRRLLG